MRLVTILAVCFSSMSFAGPLTTLVVDSTGDDPAGVGVECVTPGMTDVCTLRAALEQATANPTVTDIHFNIDPMAIANDCTDGVCTITVLFSVNSALPGIPAGVTIDGSTQPGNAGVCTNPVASRPEYRIVLRGEAGLAAGFRFESSSVGSTVRGLNFSNHADAIVFSGATDSAVECSYIGTTPDGLTAAPNLLTGIAIDCEAQNNTIGGATPELGNLISANINRQILFNAAPTCGEPSPPGPDGTVIQNNVIGPDKTGVALPIGEDGGRVNGVEFQDGVPGSSESNVIRDNVIAGNASGILLTPTATQTQVFSNFIGTDPTGTSTLGNAFGGVDIIDSSNNVIGGPGEGNVIANSQFEAVFINADGGPLPIQNTVSQNVMRDNGFGIELAPPFGLNTNDPGDVDIGSNQLQNSPELSGAELINGSLNIDYLVQSSGMLTIEFFIADGSGADGETFIGSDTYSGSGGQATAVFPMAMVQSGDPIVASATDAAGNTSEFSVNASVVEQLIVNTNLDEADGECAVDCSLRDAVALAGAGAEITFDAPLAGQTIVLTLGDILVDKLLTIDGSSLPLPVAVSGNQASRIFSLDGSEMTLRELILTGGNAGPMGEGGAIRVSGVDAILTIENSLISYNFAETAGGGIYLGSGMLRVRRCTFMRNASFYRGGAIYVSGSASAVFDNTTFSSNDGFIGEITSESTDASMEFNFSTVVSGPSSQSVFYLTNGAEIALNNSIVAVSSATQACNLSGGGTAASAMSIVEDGSCSAQDIVAAPLLDDARMLSPLAVVHAPLPGSPAIDAADNLLCPPVDQLNESRPIDGDLDGVATCDLGAFEFDRLFSDGLEQ